MQDLQRSTAARETGEPNAQVAATIVSRLEALGVRQAFGVVGGGVARLAEAIHKSTIRFTHTCHETGAALMAAEAYFATNQPAVIVTTTGPGLANASAGLAMAAWEGAKVLCIAGSTPARGRGRCSFQETAALSAEELSDGAFPRIETFHLESADQLPRLMRRLAHYWAGPRGGVARLLVAPEVQAAEVEVRPSSIAPAPMRSVSEDVIEDVSRRLQQSSVIWVGFGARHAAPLVRELAERTGARVMSSPRAKGIFPENHPQYIGVTGLFGGQEGPYRAFEEERPKHLIVLGSRLGEATSCFADEFTPSESIVHVDLDPTTFGVAYASPETLGVEMDIGDFLSRLRVWLPAVAPPTTRHSQLRTVRDAQVEGGTPVSPRALMSSVQRVVVERSDAVVFADPGNAFAWTNLLLRIDEPFRYRVGPTYGAMTHAVCGAVGATLASGKPSVALVGDGSMLMNNELTTAVRERLNVTWVILNDSSYGMVRHGMKAIGMEPFGVEFSHTDFAAMAKAVGAEGCRVKDASELDEALTNALAHAGPSVIDVLIDREEVPPFGNRNARIKKESEDA